MSANPVDMTLTGGLELTQGLCLTDIALLMSRTLDDPPTQIRFSEKLLDGRCDLDMLCHVNVHSNSRA
eukprot:m.25922 g.25922  ORF g.25922 m.25922 type:complete len:68 (+) comp13227_c0_seq3:1249-1452(+)